MSVSVDKKFAWSSTYGNRKFEVCRVIEIPNELPMKEIVFRIMEENNLPCYVEDDLTISLSFFITRETEQFFDERAAEAIEKFQTGGDVGSLAARWSKDFCEVSSSFMTSLIEPFHNSSWNMSPNLGALAFRHSRRRDARVSVSQHVSHPHPLTCFRHHA